jgi:hypothetical protein
MEILPVYCCLSCGAPSKYGTVSTDRIHCYNRKLLPMRKRLLSIHFVTIAGYGTEPSEPLYCKVHKPKGYRNVQGRLCKCSKTCSYVRMESHYLVKDVRKMTMYKFAIQDANLLEGGARISCKLCREEDHVLIGVNVCMNCQLKRATWGENLSCLLTCSDCKLPGYVRRRPKSPRCEICRKLAKFGLSGQQKTRCRGCKGSEHV